MEFHHLDAFLAVSEELHFGRAAQRLHIAQPPLTRAIKQLERELGALLFDRTTRSVRLTAAGEALIGPASDIVATRRSARNIVSAAGRGETGRVRIGFAGPSSHFMIGRLSRQVRERHPGIELALRSTTYATEAVNALQDGALDLAIVRWTHEPPGLDNRIVAEEHHVLLVPSDHRLARRKLVSISECQEEAFVALPAIPGSSLRDALVRLAAAAGFTPRIVQTAPDSWTVAALVGAGVGISVSADTAAEHMALDGVTVVALAEGKEATCSRLAWRKGDPNPALATVLRLSELALPSPNPRTPEPAPATS